jgi:serine/threonine protein kinase
MAKVVPIGQPVNESERRAIVFLRDHLPGDDWTIFHNFEMRQGNEVFEIDIAILAPHAVFLVDVKGTKGNIEVYGSRWYPAGRQPFFSPLAKLRGHARTMATLIRDANRGLYEINKVYVHAAVLLTDETAVLTDSAGIDSPDVTDFKHCVKYFMEKSRFISGGWLTDIRRFHAQISKVICGAKPKNTTLVFQNWQVEEKLGGTDKYIEYRAKHIYLGASGGMARLKVYHTDPYQDEAAKDEEFKKISNAYRAVAHMPSHENILSVRDIIVSEDKDYVVLVTEDLPGQALRLCIKKQSLALTFDQKLQVMHDVLAALDHAHHYEVIHRNLTPDAILLTEGGASKLTSFDFARVGKDRVSTIAAQVVDDVDPNYQAPECYRDPAQASIASDLYSAGLIFYELLTGERPFESADQMLEADGKFPIKPSEHNKRLPEGFDAWLQGFCEFDPEERVPSAAVALQILYRLVMPKEDEGPEGGKTTPTSDNRQQPDMKNLPPDYILTDRFRIQEKLGQGGFAVTYKVFDVLGDIVRVLKLVTHDRKSVYARMCAEYQILVNLPEHPHVVRVIWADHLMDKDQTPYIVFEYVDGLDVSDLIGAGALSLEDSARILRETAEGLLHLHAHGVYHQDIKPNNLIWTEKGVRIIDFNVSVTEKNQDREGIGGTRRYMPPDLDCTAELDVSDRIDQDLYGLGITFYECLTNSYPFAGSSPSHGAVPKDPRSCTGCADISESLVKLLMKMIAPRRKDRFTSVEELLKALDDVKTYRAPISTSKDKASPSGGKRVKPAAGGDNTNPFVTHLLTLYSQSQYSNAGTRGLDAIGKQTYAPTFLDERLKPELLKGTFSLVIISGNAGDGKTAFIQQVEDYARSQGADLKRGPNGAVFKLKDHTYRSNYDGSQDEGDERNDVVLKNFFAPFAGADKSKRPKKETRLIAINEGRLVDFFQEHEKEYPLLAQEIENGLKGDSTSEGIAVINLNLRSVVAPSCGDGRSILEHLLERMTRPEDWQACEKCDIKHKCYALYNARTFQDPVAGPKVTERLKLIYTVTHLRAKLHITMRDARSALAYMLAGTRNCEEIHRLYLSGDAESAGKILDGFYFNSWLGGAVGSQDRLISLLREIDVAEVSNPDLDRKLSFFNPTTLAANRLTLADRSAYDDELLEKLFNQLPQTRSHKEGFSSGRIKDYRNYLAYLRRRHYFERRDVDRRDDGWKEMLPYGNIGEYMNILGMTDDKRSEKVSALLEAINRGEGLNDAQETGSRNAAPIRGLALRVRQVDKGTIRSYRLFKGEYFSLSTDAPVSESPFLERFPQTLFLEYDSGGRGARLRINLDLYEILMRLKDGYRPSVEVLEGFYLNLTVFKNVLSASPYQEALLTDNDLGFYRVRRDDQGILHMEKLSQEAEI